MSESFKEKNGLAELLLATLRDRAAHSITPEFYRDVIEFIESQARRIAELERENDELMKERDYADAMCDALSAGIAGMTDIDIGEHSSANFPWDNANRAAEEFIATRRTAPPLPAHQFVWMVSNKTSILVFATEKDAQEFVSSYPMSVAGGLSINRVPVVAALRAPAEQAQTCPHGFDLRTVCCKRCEDPAFDAAQRPPATKTDAL